MFITCVLAIAIALQYSPVPIPRQAANDSARSDQSNASEAASNQTPSLQLSATGEITNAPESQTPSGTIGAVNEQRTITAGESSTMTKQDIFNFLTILVGIGQGILLFFTLRAIRRQVDIADEQRKISDGQRTIAAEQLVLTQPRLHVESVRAGWFRVGQQPIFFVKIMNSGLISADNASVMMRVSMGDKTIKYQQDQIIAIPSSGWRECFIRYGGPLQATQLDDFDSGKTPLRISGHVIWNKQTINYCYRYYAWPFKETRPKGLRKFVPCDFDPKLAFEASVDVGAYLIAATDATLKTDKPTKE